MSQSHSDSKHTDHTVHGAILPPHRAASWNTQEKTQSLVFKMLFIMALGPGLLKGKSDLFCENSWKRKKKSQTNQNLK